MSMTTSHPVNLAVLQHFYDEDIIHIESDSMYDSTPLVDTPPINLFAHNWTNNWTKFLAGDHKADLSLKEVADAVKQDQQVFTHLSEPILESLSDELGKSDLYSWQTLVLFSNIGLKLLALAFMIYLAVKLHMVQSAVTALALAQKVNSQDPFFLIPRSTTRAPPIYVRADDSVLSDDRLMMYTLIIFTSVTLIFLIYNRLSQRRPRASFVLEISNNTHCIIIKLLEVSNCPRFYHVQANDNFYNLAVEWYIFPRFVWNKGSLQLTHVLDKSRPAIPQSVPITILTALKLRRMLKGSVYAYLLVEHCDRVFQLQVCPLTCTDCVLQVRTVESVPYVDAHELKAV